MKIYERYVHKEHGRLLLLTVSALCSVYVLIVFLDLVDDAIERKVSALYALEAALLRIPMGLRELGSISVLLSVIVFMALSSRNLEPVILRSLGVRLRSVLKPLLVQGAIFSLVLLVNSLAVAPYFLSRSNDVVQERIKGAKKRRRTSPVRMWLKSGGYMCYIGYFNEKRLSLGDVRCFKQKEPWEVIQAPRVVWKGKWKATGVRLWVVKKDVPEFVERSDMVLSFLPSPGELKGRRKTLDEMDAGDLIYVVRQLKKEGIRSEVYQAELFNRIFFSMFPVVMVLVAFPLGISGPRKGQVATSFVKGVVLAFLFYGVYYAFTLAGREALLPPALASLLPLAGGALCGLWFSGRVDA